MAGQPVLAADKGSSGKQAQTKGEAQMPHCSKKLGTIAIVEPDKQWWKDLNLGSPEAILKIFVQESGCFSLVNRGAAAQSSAMERAMASNGDLQRGSNVGKAQVKAADYFLQPDIVTSNKNSGGNKIGGMLGGLMGGTFGAIAGGINIKKSEANVTLSIVNARTTEEEALTQGYARKSDLSFGAGGGAGWWGGFAGVGGGGYQNTDIGQVIVLAYLDAYTKLVTQLGGLSGNAAAAAPIRSYAVQQVVTMRKAANAKAAVVRSLPVGAIVYPTGNKEDVWWEIADENDNVGWVNNTALAPAK
ncbi:MAG: penicillin-binding protein activator LpoB [Sphingobium sp.]|nr:penicillin-binding protein activator LpoB [Sphingobium sp.]